MIVDNLLKPKKTTLFLIYLLVIISPAMLLTSGAVANTVEGANMDNIQQLELFSTNDIAVRRCNGCLIIKSYSEFHRQKCGKNGRRSECKECMRRKVLLIIPCVPDNKKCTKCKTIKTADKFYPNKCDRSGLGVWCKSCMLRQLKTDCNKGGHLYEKKRARDNIWIKQNLEKVRARGRVNDKSPKRKAKKKQWANVNKESRYARAKEIREKYPERHRLAAVINHARRRALENHVTGTHTKEQWVKLCEYYGNKCLCCGHDGKMTLDHIIPISRPWSSNDIKNIQPLCKSCNSRKHTDVVDYRPDKSSLVMKVFA